MKIKIIQNKPLAYQTSPIDETFIEISKEEEALLSSGKRLMFSNGKIVVDEQAQKEYEDLKIKRQIERNYYNELKELENWFNIYDEAVVQFARKETLHNQHFIDEVAYTNEVEKITKLHLDAEDKAKRINQLRDLLGIQKYKL